MGTGRKGQCHRRRHDEVPEAWSERRLQRDGSQRIPKAALADAKESTSEIQSAYCGYVYGDSTYGLRSVYELGLARASMSST
jgi:hypothetical protein